MPDLLPTPVNFTYTHNSASAHPISKFENPSETKNIRKQVTCYSTNHKLLDKEEIEIFDSEGYDGTYRVINVAQDKFDIEKNYLEYPTEGKWIRKKPNKDPFSFQVSFVFPDWINRFKNEEFRNIVCDTIRKEIPAHITPYFNWFNQNKMKSFEETYFAWLSQIMSRENDIRVDRNVYRNITVKMMRILSIDKFHDIQHIEDD